MTGPKQGSSDDFGHLFDRARAGDNAAWETLFEQCYPKIIRVVRRKLNKPMRSLYDSTDFASDVMKSLAANAGRLDFPSFDSLIAFLVQVAEQKVIDEYRRVHTLKRDLDRECRLTEDGGDDDDARPLGLTSSDPTPSEVAVAGEAHERLLAGQSAPEREAIELKHLGYTNSEIAARTGWHPRKVQRLFKRLWDSWGLAKDGRRVDLERT